MNRRAAVTGVPAWVDADRLLGPSFRHAGEAWVADLTDDEAADLAARLRGVALGGHPLDISIEPSLPRALVRAARADDARRRRDTTPGFDRRGAQLDEEGRWSLTPAALALALGGEAAGRKVIDVGCGCGGDTIGFARGGAAVIAVERDPTRLAMARHNAALYGVASQIRFVLGDGVALLPTLIGDLVYVDPPWGRDAAKERTTLADLPLLAAVLTDPREVWAKVPAGFDPTTVPGATATAVFGRAAGDDRRVKFTLLRRRRTTPGG